MLNRTILLHFLCFSLLLSSTLAAFHSSEHTLPFHGGSELAGSHDHSQGYPQDHPQDLHDEHTRFDNIEHLEIEALCEACLLLPGISESLCTAGILPALETLPSRLPGASRRAIARTPPLYRSRAPPRIA